MRLVALALMATCAGAVAAAIPGLANPAAAGEPAADSASRSTAIEPIATGDIPMRADIDERFAADVTVRSKGRDPSRKLRAELERIAAGIADLSQTFARVDLRQLSAIRLGSLENHWKFYQRELDDWRAELDRTTGTYTEDASELAKRRAAWEATRDSMAGGGVTAALVDRVDVVIGELGRAERALSAPLDEQLKLRRRASSVQSSIDAGKKSVAAAITHYDRRLGTIDATPAWEAWSDTRFDAVEIRDAKSGLQLETAFVEEWGAANRERLTAYAVGAVVLLPLLLWLGWRSRKAEARDPGLEAAAKVLRRPLSAWLLLVFIGVPFFFGDAPLVMHQLALLLALIPVLRLLPPRVFEVLGSWPAAGTALYVLYRLNVLLLGNPLYYRLYMLAISLVTMAALAWLLVSSRQRHRQAGTAAPHGVVRVIAWLAVASLLVAIVANVAGNVSLAEMLTGAVLDSAYVGLVLYAGANVIASVFRFLLARRAVARFRVITANAGPVLAGLTRLVMFGALVAWVLVVLHEFRIARPLFRSVTAVLDFPLEAGEISVTLRSILLFVASIYVAFWIARTVRYVLRDEMLPNVNLPRGVANSVASLSYYGLVLVGLMVALAAAGFEASQFAIVFGALGVGIGFGLQNVVNNFVSGLILMFERPIQPGDIVEVSGTSGKVREIGMRATTLTTFEGADVVVPNGTLLSEKLINWTLSDMDRRIDVNVGVAYGTDPRRVLELLEEVARTTPGVAVAPAPNIVFMGFGASSLDFSIRAWTKDFGDWVNIRSQLTVRIYEALRQAGIEIPFPQQDLHLRSVSPEAASRLAGDTRPAAPSARSQAPARAEPATEC